MALTPPTWPLPRLWRPAYDRLTAHRWGRMLWLTWTEVQEDEVPLVGASIAYYALFSIFPILLFFVIAASGYLGAQPDRVTNLVGRYLPGAEVATFFQDTLESALEQRPTTGFLALLALLYSGSGVFTAITRGINRAWDVTQPRPLWQARLLGVGLAFGLGLLPVLSLAATTLLNVLDSLPQLGWLPGWGILFLAVPIVINLFMFLTLYTVLPNERISWRWALPGAVFAALVWEALKGGFAFYLQHFNRYNLVYGSVGAIIIFLLWAYLSAYILLAGAELCQAYARVFHGYRAPDPGHRPSGPS